MFPRAPDAAQRPSRCAAEPGPIPLTYGSRLCVASLRAASRPGHGSEAQIISQVTPVRVELLDQRDLPGAPPPLHRMLACPRFENRLECLEIDELVDLIFPGEARNELSFVLGQASREIVGDANIERPVAPTCENVDKIRGVHLFMNRDYDGPE